MLVIDIPFKEQMFLPREAKKVAFKCVHHILILLDLQGCLVNGWVGEDLLRGKHAENSVSPLGLLE